MLFLIEFCFFVFRTRSRWWCSCWPTWNHQGL